MVEEVRSVLRPGDEAIVSDLTELELERPVDVVFSSAVFHWIDDHELLFRRMAAALRPGGRLAAQFGGAGNIAGLRIASEEVAGRDPFARSLRGLRAALELRRRRRRPRSACARAGFAEARCWLQPWEIFPPEPAEFLRTVCLGPHMDRLPEELRDPFVDEVLAHRRRAAQPRVRPPQHRGPQGAS